MHAEDYAVAFGVEPLDAIPRSSRRSTLKVLVSTEYTDLTLHVPSHFKTLMILRCAPAVDGGVLFVDGASTYAGIRLDSWQADYRRHRGCRLSSSAMNGASPSGLLKVPQDGTSSATEPSSVARSSRSSAAHAETINDNNKGIDKKKAAGSALILGAAVGTSRILHSLGRLDELPSSRTVLALGYDQRSVGKIAIPGAGMVRNPKHKAEHREP